MTTSLGDGLFWILTIKKTTSNQLTIFSKNRYCQALFVATDTIKPIKTCHMLLCEEMGALNIFPFEDSGFAWHLDNLDHGLFLDFEELGFQNLLSMFRYFFSLL